MSEWASSQAGPVGKVNKGALDDVSDANGPVRDMGRKVFAATVYQAAGKRPDARAGVN